MPTSPATCDLARTHHIWHPAYVRADEALWTALSGNEPIILVVGPTGVGKSRLIRATAERIMAEASSRITSRSALLPAAVFTLRMSAGRPSWCEFLEQYLRALSHPTPKVTQSAEGLARIVSAQRERETKAVFVDDAHSLLAGAQPSQRAGFPSALRALTNGSATKLVLTGSYALLDLVHSDAQMARRVAVVHLRRYSMTPVDRSGFRSLIDLVRRDTPLPLPADEQRLHEGCAGIIGIMMQWIHAAECEHALTKVDPDKALAASRPSGARMAVIVRDCYAGEALLEPAPSSLAGRAANPVKRRAA